MLSCSKRIIKDGYFNVDAVSFVYKHDEEFKAGMKVLADRMAAKYQEKFDSVVIGTKLE